MCSVMNRILRKLLLTSLLVSSRTGFYSLLPNTNEYYFHRPVAKRRGRRCAPQDGCTRHAHASISIRDGGLVWRRL